MSSPALVDAHISTVQQLLAKFSADATSAVSGDATKSSCEAEQSTGAEVEAASAAVDDDDASGEDAEQLRRREKKKQYRRRQKLKKSEEVKALHRFRQRVLQIAKENSDPNRKEDVLDMKHIRLGCMDITQWAKHQQHRAVYATQDLKKGDLVLCEKAEAYVAEAGVYDNLIDVLRKHLPQKMEMWMKRVVGAALVLMELLSAKGSLPWLEAVRPTQFSEAFPPSDPSAGIVADGLRAILLAMGWNPKTGIGFETIALGTVKMMHNIYYQEMGDRGCAFFPVGAMFNHSCIANCDYVSFGSKDDKAAYLRVRARRDIAKGEELTINYCADLGNDKADRRYQLFCQFQMEECKCQACAEDMCITDTEALLTTRHAILVNCFWCGIKLCELGQLPKEDHWYCSDKCKLANLAKFPDMKIPPPRGSKESAELRQVGMKWVMQLAEPLSLRDVYHSVNLQKVKGENLLLSLCALLHA